MLCDMTTAAPAAFKDLGLIDALLGAIAKQGYERPTPIQAQAIPHVLAARDVLGCAQTGTGKTAAFALPILQRLDATHAHRAKSREAHVPRVLVLAPTRELATQIGDSFTAYGAKLNQRTAVIFGGVGQAPQVNAVRRGVDIVVATPGRLLDLANQRLLRLDGIEILVLDEADRMLDMGFLPDMRRILALLPKQKQALLFSATMPPEIRHLANQILHKPVEIAVTPVATTAERIEQHLCYAEKRDKQAVLQGLLARPEVQRVLVFTRTKRDANRCAKALVAARIGAEAIHGNKSQGARERALDGFKDGRTRVLVATDIAARGIDVDGITHVINMDIPDVPETYVHRIGRTARAGASGVAYSLCSSEERANLRAVEKLIRMPIPVVGNVPRGIVAEEAPRSSRPPQRGGQRFEPRGSGRGGGGHGHGQRGSGQHGQGTQGRRPLGSHAPAASRPATKPPLQHGFSDRGRGPAKAAREFGQFGED